MIMMCGQNHEMKRAEVIGPRNANAILSNKKRKLAIFSQCIVHKLVAETDYPVFYISK